MGFEWENFSFTPVWPLSRPWRGSVWHHFYIYRSICLSTEVVESDFKMYSKAKVSSVTGAYRERCLAPLKARILMPSTEDTLSRMRWWPGAHGRPVETNGRDSSQNVFHIMTYRNYALFNTCPAGGGAVPQTPSQDIKKKMILSCITRIYILPGYITIKFRKKKRNLTPKNYPRAYRTRSH